MGAPDIITPLGGHGVWVLAALLVLAGLARGRRWGVVFWLPPVLWAGWVLVLAVSWLGEVGGGPVGGFVAAILLGVIAVVSGLGVVLWKIRPRLWSWAWAVGTLIACVAAGAAWNEHEKVPVRIRVLDGEGRPLKSARIKMWSGKEVVWFTDANGEASGYWRPRQAVWMTVEAGRGPAWPSPRAFVAARLEFQPKKSGYRVERHWTRSVGGGGAGEWALEHVETGRLRELRVVLPRAGEIHAPALREQPGLSGAGTPAGVWIERLETLAATDSGGELEVELVRLLASFWDGVDRLAADAARMVGGEVARENRRFALLQLARWADTDEGAEGDAAIMAAEEKLRRLMRHAMERALNGSAVDTKRLRAMAELGRRTGVYGDELVDRLAEKTIEHATFQNGALGHELHAMMLSDAQLGRLLDTGRPEWILAVCEARRNRLGGELGARLERELRRVRPEIGDAELARWADRWLADFEREAARADAR